MLTFHADTRDPLFGKVTAANIAWHLLFAYPGGKQVPEFCEAAFHVAVADSMAAGSSLPAIAGRYESVGDRLCFTPHFPFVRGLNYRATLDLRSPGGLTQPLTLDFALPALPPAAPAVVEEVYPTSAHLPENLLRFYVKFAQPMQRGQAGTEIVLLGPDGEPAPDVLYRPPVELWDRQMRCLTVLLDPGRLKRGVGPNRALGPPLKSGEQYTLAIGAGLRDLSGRPLHQAFHKTFRVTEAVRDEIDVDAWDLRPPAKGTRMPLAVFFPHPLDWALLSNSIAVRDSSGLRFPGHIDIGAGERGWSFTPRVPWSAGEYQMRISRTLEDVCGNNLLGAFDRALSHSPRGLAQEGTMHVLPFVIAT